MNKSLITVNWEGSLFVHHSLGMVNRELLSELVADEQFDFRHVPYEPDQFSYKDFTRYLALGKILAPPHSHPQIHISHRWPPRLTRPSCDKYVVILPWEYGSIPVQWRDSIGKTIDEAWVPSKFVKNCFIKSGVA